MLDDRHLENILLQAKIATPAKVRGLLQRAADGQVSLEELLISQHVIDEEALYQAAAQHFQLPYVDLANTIISKDLLEVLPEPIAQTRQVIVFDRRDGAYQVATTEPHDLETIEFIKRKTGAEVAVHLTTPASLRYVLKQYHQSLEAEFLRISGEGAPEASGEEVPSAKLQQLAQDLPIIRIVDTLLEYAIFESASDIHIEPTERDVVVRYRIDGVLRDVMSLPKTLQSGLVARIKVLANLKLDEHRLPQDGRFKVSSERYRMSVRVSLLPVYDGEKAVLRLLDESGRLISLEQLGLQPETLETLRRSIAKPHGLALVTGPTGSGKTTTLYAALHTVSKPEVNIVTIEDPIEYRMPRVNQSQVNPKIGYTFANGLRSLLRQDPNVIMVGEIRDLETAEISIHAAMTGHLVLSTLHTNGALATVPRLLDMGIAPFLVASTLSAVIAQRLVRRLCPNCLISYQPGQALLREFSDRYPVDRLRQTLVECGVIASTDQELTELLFYRGKGCTQCGHTGYRGRVGIYEILEITPGVAELIIRQSSLAEFSAAAQQQGFRPMFVDGLRKAKAAITSFEEVLRVTRE